MSDREERAMAAGSRIRVGDREYVLRPITVQHLCDLGREALRHYKKQYLDTFRENADLLSGGAEDFLRSKMEEAARWSLDDLPKSTVYDVSRVPITKHVERWVREYLKQFGIEDDGEIDENVKERRIRAILVTALDQERLSPKSLAKMTGKPPMQGRVRYDQWWITACLEGMIAFLHTSLQYEQKDVTREEIGRWSIADIMESVREAESITSPAMGNG